MPPEQTSWKNPYREITVTGPPSLSRRATLLASMLTSNGDAYYLMYPETRAQTPLVKAFRDGGGGGVCGAKAGGVSQAIHRRWVGRR